MNFDPIEWLQQPPDEKDLVEVEPGIYTHPYESIVEKLDRIGLWDTRNFNHFLFTMPDGSVKVSGSIEVVLQLYKDGVVTERNLITTKVMTGAATFDVNNPPFKKSDDDVNPHWAATVKSLAIVNAVQVLGPQFGWGLNAEAPNKKKILVPPVKYKPDEGIMRQFATAVEKKNVKAIKVLLDTYQIDTEGTDLTWVK